MGVLKEEKSLLGRGNRGSKGLGVWKAWQVWEIEGACSLSYQILKGRGKEAPLSEGFSSEIRLDGSCRGSLQVFPGSVLPHRCSCGWSRFPVHSHPLPLPRRVASQKERGREEADKKDSFCLDTNILVISTDGMRNTKKSTWQFRENLVKCYIFLTYLCRVFGPSTWILQNLVGLGVMPQPSGVFISEMFPFPSTKVSLWFFFSPTKIRRRICLWRCVSLFGRQAV